MGEWRLDRLATQAQCTEGHNRPREAEAQTNGEDLSRRTLPAEEPPRGFAGGAEADGLAAGCGQLHGRFHPVEGGDHGQRAAGGEKRRPRPLLLRIKASSRGDPERFGGQVQIDDLLVEEVGPEDAVDGQLDVGAGGDHVGGQKQLVAVFDLAQQHSGQAHERQITERIPDGSNATALGGEAQLGGDAAVDDRERQGGVNQEREGRRVANPALDQWQAEIALKRKPDR